MGIFHVTEVRFDLLHLVFDGRSTWVPNMTTVASFCTLSTFSRFVGAIFVKRSP